MTKERPILFSAPMVRAVLEGRKAQTRRVIKPQPAEPPAGWYPDAYNHSEMWTFWGPRGTPEQGRCTLPLFKCPYGKPGDRLWVRENFNVIVHSDMTDEDRVSVTYRADNKPAMIQLDTDTEWEQAGRLKKHDTVPSIHMPRWASRITLEIAAVRVERLQDISEIDSRAEGIEQVTDFRGEWFCYDNSNPNAGVFKEARTAFYDFWQSINGADSWDANPWVWVVEFKNVEKIAA